MKARWFGAKLEEIGRRLQMKKTPTVFDFDAFVLDAVQRRPQFYGMASAAAAVPEAGLEDDPQVVSLQGALYIAKGFKYVANFAVGANATQAQNIQIDSDADFQLINLIGSRDAVGLQVQIAEGGAGGLSWQSAAVNFDNFFGTAQLPFPFGLIPQLLPKKRVYNISINNTTGGLLNAQVVYDGYKLFPVSMAAQIGAQPTPPGQ